MTTTAPQQNPQPRPLVLLRPVPGPSPIHSLWAGTKLIIVFAIGVLLTFYPGWVPIGCVAVLVGMAMWMARVPRSVLPSVPYWVWLIVLFGGVTAALAGKSPYVDIGSLHLGLGGVLSFLRITVLSIVLLLLGGLVSWTTNVSEIAPAVSTLGRPLKWLRLPIDDWAVTLALALRSFPMLIDEFRLLYAARRLRPKPELHGRRERRRYLAHEVIDLITAAIVVMLRRADEMGDAITARGGTGQITAAPTRPKSADWLALSIVAVVCGIGLALELTVAGTSGRG
jgi:energy-coupling factor transport system permease protein